MHPLAVTRRRHLLTQQELADACGLSKSTISKLERRAVQPTWSTAGRIAEVLDTPAHILFSVLTPGPLLGGRQAQGTDGGAGSDMPAPPEAGT